MGVAAIDVPLYEFERLFQSYRLGVGGYAFVIDQNGNILTHPDFRPLVSSFKLIDDQIDYDTKFFSHSFKMESSNQLTMQSIWPKWNLWMMDMTRETSAHFY